MSFQTKFYQAVKTAQRAVQEIINRDKTQMQKILNTSRYITHTLDYYNSRVQNTTVLAKAGRVPDLIGGYILNVSSFWSFEIQSVILNILHAVQMEDFFPE